MRNLLNFIIKYSTWFIFLFYVLICCILLVENSPYQQSVYLTSANVVTAKIDEMRTSVTRFFNLPGVNASLEQQNREMAEEITRLKAQLKDYNALVSDSSATLYSPEVQNRFKYILATVINESNHRPRNYITINKGFADGIEPGMGVVDHSGVVGIVGSVGDHTSRIISLIHESQKISVKVKGTEFIGTYRWKGHDPRIGYVDEIPRHAKLNIGDTVVTTGYSSSFPDGIPIGTIVNKVRDKDESNFSYKIRLNPEFGKLTGVRVIKDFLKAELDTLEKFDVK